MPSRRLGILKVDLSLLGELLRLPSGVKIVDAFSDRRPDRNGAHEVRLMLEGEDEGLPSCPEGYVVPVVTLQFTAGDPGPGRITR